MSMTHPTRKAIITAVLGAVVAITPSLLVYAQATQEMRLKYHAVDTEADAGYKTLVDSVRELQQTVREQHDRIVKLQGYIEALRGLQPDSLRMTALPPPQPAPAFAPLPGNLDAATAQAAMIQVEDYGAKAAK